MSIKFLNNVSYIEILFTFSFAFVFVFIQTFSKTKYVWGCSKRFENHVSGSIPIQKNYDEVNK